MDRRRFLSLGALAPVALATASHESVTTEPHTAIDRPVSDVTHTVSTGQDFHCDVVIDDDALRQYVLVWAAPHTR